MARHWWDSLSNDELRARLVARGYNDQAARNLVIDRDLELARACIHDLIGDDE